jgi:3',5'-cyclic-nucleotide phosphodiesterase
LLRGPAGDALARAGVPDAAALAFVRQIRATYEANAFHNYRHVVSVLHCAALVLAAPALADAVPPLLRFAILVAALGHDAGHPGTTSAFEVKLRTPLAVAHGGAGPVLERYHAATTLAALERAGVFAAQPPAARAAALETVRAAIISTDMAVHNAVLASQQARATRCAGGAPPLDGTAADADAFAGELLHVADLSAAAYGAADMQFWAAGLYAEFTALPARERDACLPVTPFFAGLVGAPLAQAKMQVGFVRDVVRPLWAALDGVAGGALAGQCARVDAALIFHEAEVARLSAAGEGK